MQNRNWTSGARCVTILLLNEADKGEAMDNYYRRLRDLREDHDYSQQQVADYLSMKQPQYSRYERGLRDIPTDVLIRLAQLYHTSTDYLLGLTNNPKPPAK